MKKFFALILALVLLCGMLTACENAESMLKKADEALLNAPYTMTMNMKFETDNTELSQILSMMNLEVPVTVDGKNMAMDMSMDIMGVSADVKATVVDMVMYYDVQVMGQSVKMKAVMNDEQYKEFMEENNTSMVVDPEDFAKLTVEKKDGKKYIACAEITEEGLKELNEMMEKAVKSMDGKVTVDDISYGLTLSGGKYEKMDLSCTYSVTVGDKTSTVTFKVSAEFSYENVAKITAPADADKYTSMDFEDLMGG